MFSLTITEKGGESIVQDFEKDEVTIGRIQGNDIVLPKSNISKRHARILHKNGTFEVADSKSTNGTYINGKRIDAPQELHIGDRVIVGDFTIEVQPAQAQVPPPPPPKDAMPAAVGGVLPDDAWGGGDAASKEQWNDAWAKDDASASANRPVAGGAADAAAVTAGRAPFPAPPGGAAPGAPKAPRPPMPPTVRPKADLEGPSKPGGATSSTAWAPSAAVPGPDFGPLQALVNDDMVAQVLVNGAQHVYVERGGKLAAADCALGSEDDLKQLITRVVTSCGGYIGGEHPFAEVRLPDGSRLSAVLPPLALRGSVLSLRKAMREPMQIDDLVAFGTLSGEMAEMLETCIKARVNVILCGAPGAGLTMTLNVLASFIATEDRVVTVEEAAELKLDQPHIVSLEGRTPTGSKVTSVDELVRIALRLRPDRLVVDDCASSTPALLQALASGFDGCLATLRASGPEDAIARLEGIVLAGAHDLPPPSARAQLAIGVGLIVHQARLTDGTRRVVRIAEVAGLEGGVVMLRDIFVFEPRGVDRAGHVQGGFRATGVVPRVYEQLRASGVQIDTSAFSGG